MVTGKKRYPHRHIQNGSEENVGEGKFFFGGKTKNAGCKLPQENLTNYNKVGNGGGIPVSMLRKIITRGLETGKSLKGVPVGPTVDSCLRYGSNKPGRIGLYESLHLTAGTQGGLGKIFQGESGDSQKGTANYPFKN